MRSALIALLFTAALATAADDAVETVKKLEATYEQALIKKDIKTLDRMMTADFIRTPPTSVATSKSEYLSQIESGRLQYLTHETVDAKYRAFGDTVIVHSVVKLRTKSNGTEAEQSLRLMHVWVKQEGVWRIAAVQGNQMTTPRPPQ